MLTIFSIPKPFQGHIKTIQINAIRSWLLLRPRCEVILFGDAEGTSKVASELGIRHIPGVTCNEFGTPLVNVAFKRAEELKGFPLMAYVNADIILMSDFIKSVKRIQEPSFLMVGQRWGLRMNQLLDFDNPDWESKLRASVAKHRDPHLQYTIDYFVFTPGLFKDMPPFAVGRPQWDNWAIYQAHSLGKPVIDATRVVLAVHQHHDYAHHPGGEKGMKQGIEAQRNHRLAGSPLYLFSLNDATHILTPRGLKKLVKPNHYSFINMLYVFLVHFGFLVGIVRFLSFRICWLYNHSKIVLILNNKLFHGQQK